LQNCINTVGTTQKLTDTYSLTLYNAIVYELNNKNITNSKNLFNTHKDNIFSEYQIKINEMIYIEELQKELENTTATQALELLDNAENKITFTQKQNINRINSLKEFFWIELINQESEKQNYIQAAKIAENAISKMPNNQNLKRIKNQCLKNHGITIHNKIVPLVNSKNYSQAIKILEEGLKENPNSIEIKNDLNRLKKFAY
jgi:tetratricopeptide (TPR) repeat protein